MSPSVLPPVLRLVLRLVPPPELRPGKWKQAAVWWPAVQALRSAWLP